MQVLTITLKTITPMFLTGADGKTPELRIPSIKGALRFWWRAIQCNPSIEKLRDEEDKLFGSSDEKTGRSKFSLRIMNATLQSNNYKPVPTKDFKAPAFKPDQTFNLVLSSYESFDRFEMISNLLKISLILGGFGKRSRRGFGSLTIVKENNSDFTFDYSLQSICDLLNAIVPQGFKVDANKIIRINTVSEDANYPYIKEIEIGNRPCSSWEALIKKIGNEAHSHDCYYTGFTERAGQKSYRFASPVYVSIIMKQDSQYYPIVTTLNCALEEGVIDKLSNKEKKTDNTVTFKKAVLS